MKFISPHTTPVSSLLPLNYIFKLEGLDNEFEYLPLKFGIKLGYLFKQDPNKCAPGDARGKKQSEQYQNNR